jgi:hypothetical protein
MQSPAFAMATAGKPNISISQYLFPNRTLKPPSGGWGVKRKTLRGNGGFKPKPTAYEKIFIVVLN